MNEWSSFFNLCSLSSFIVGDSWSFLWYPRWKQQGSCEHSNSLKRAESPEMSKKVAKYVVHPDCLLKCLLAAFASEHPLSEGSRLDVASPVETPADGDVSAAVTVELADGEGSCVV